MLYWAIFLKIQVGSCHSPLSLSSPKHQAENKLQTPFPGPQVPPGFLSVSSLSPELTRLQPYQPSVCFSNTPSTSSSGPLPMLFPPPAVLFLQTRAWPALPLHSDLLKCILLREAFSMPLSCRGPGTHPATGPIPEFVCSITAAHDISITVGCYLLLPLDCRAGCLVHC